MSEEKVKKIRDLESFTSGTPISKDDFLIVATSAGVAATQKASIEEVINAYNQSISDPGSDSGITDPSDPTSKITDPETAPGYTNDLDGDGVADEKIDTTPLNAGNIGQFVDPNGGLTVTQECRTKDTKALVDCDDPTAYYKKNVLSTAGFDGNILSYKDGKFQNKKTYAGGILKSITYGVGEFLQLCMPSKDSEGWYIFYSEYNLDFRGTFFTSKNWIFSVDWADWMYIMPVPTVMLNVVNSPDTDGGDSTSGSGESYGFWMWQQNIGWFFMMPGTWPFIWLHSDSDWAYINPTFSSNNNVNGFTKRIYFYSSSNWQMLDSLGTAASDQSGTVPTTPSFTITSNAPGTTPTRI